MPLMFSTLCELLQSLENDLKRKRHQKGSKQIVNEWFTRNQDALNQMDLTTLLSTLLPERRTDRVFNIKLKRLENIVVKACGLGSSRIAQLREWEVEGAGVDFADCVEAILKATPNVAEQDVTVEEIDSILHQLAAGVAFSSPSVRLSIQNPKPPTTLVRREDNSLVALFRRLTAKNAKWFSRLILKDFLPVVVPEHLVYSRCHPLLPIIMRIHDDFAVATSLLAQQTDPSRVLHANTEVSDVPRLVKPQIGVKIGRQTWLKARSIKHCIEMGGGLMSCEEKVDGEYCQIHIDLSKGRNDCIQIFSKSGKDSTMDRWQLHRAIRSSLRIGRDDCKFKERCILEGEMVVYSDIEKRVLGFEKIRKHVKRSGRYIGTEQDSPPRAWERLMIVYFDVLLVDDQSMLNVRHSERRRRLSSIVKCQAGEAELVQSTNINFTSRIAARELQRAFASCLVKRQEGLVLKPDEPYLSFGPGKRKYASCCLKLKKGYIKNCGEIGDIAVIGARCDSTRAKVLCLPDTKYTHFYLGCLLNKDNVVRFNAKPKFKVINEVEPSATILEQFRRYVFPIPVPFEENSKFDLDVPPGMAQGSRISTLFEEPPVFEITCFSFHKESGTDFWSPRFPYASKIHSDRSWKDCLDFTELQELAEDETKAPEKEDSQEMARLLQMLEKAEPKRRRENVDRGSQSTTTTLTTVGAENTTPECSPVKSRDLYRAARACTAVSASIGVITPPTSSEIQPPQEHFPASSISKEGSARKRRISQTESSRRVKHRRSVEQSTILVTPNPLNRNLRQPLEDLASSSSSQGNILSRPRPDAAKCEVGREELDAENLRLEPVAPRLLASCSFHSPAGVSGPPKPRLKRLLSTKTSFSGASDQSSVCHHVGATCALANHSVLLSPCVASMPWLAEDLLPSHGLSAIFKDISSWMASSSLPDGASRRQRRIVLVERRRSEATKSFLKQLQVEPLRRQNGETEVVIAYDWRLLEAITDEEKAKVSNEGNKAGQKGGTGAQARELWKKHYIGLC